MAAGDHGITAYDLDKLVEDGAQSLDLWAGFRRAIHGWGDGAAILCLLLLILKLLGDSLSSPRLPAKEAFGRH